MVHGAPDNYMVRQKANTYVLLDLAELAVRLGAISIFDRLGDTLILDGFEDGLLRWESLTDGTGADVSLNGSYSKSGGFSVKLTGGSDGDKSAGIKLYNAEHVASKMGFEVAFNLDSNVESVNMYFDVYDGAKKHSSSISYDNTNNIIKRLDDSGSMINLFTGVNIYNDPNSWVNFKMVVDLETNEYIRFKYDLDDIGLSDLPVYSTIDLTVPHFEFWFEIISIGGLNGISFLDNIIITQNEF